MAFNSVERKALTGLAMLYASRMLGLFMVLPVLSLYGMDLEKASPQTLGLALGIYGITQALLQIPFGAASDRFGRKPLIVLGLVIFLVGSIVAALSTHVMGLVFGRALQGAGAISSVVLALLADYTRESERSKAMAIVGAVIGSSFVVAVMIGPWIAGFGGLAGLFWFTAGLALLGMLVLLWLPPVPGLQIHQERKFHASQIGQVLRDGNVLILSLGVFLLHMTMTALFVALPIVLVDRGFAADDLGQVYAPVMIIAFLGMAPMMMLSERNNAQVKFLRLAAVLISIALVALVGVKAGAASALALLLFFVGFNFIEATLPSLLSRKAEAQSRGTAMGVFATAQFIGAAAGGMVGGLLFANQQLLPIVAVGFGAQIVWIVLLGLVKPVKSTQTTPTESVG
ncbi:MFS transporter [Reinekea sp. G2M2-21]|uniref:MFS transporter n=1 Tax=Reinekea sp. G2M2-21 TaxID=2788942 RepID=UPI0018ABD3C3|nr:MFS transporter [Reinekea sp. G2M2-21]